MSSFGVTRLHVWKSTRRILDDSRQSIGRVWSMYFAVTGMIHSWPDNMGMLRCLVTNNLAAGREFCGTTFGYNKARGVYAILQMEKEHSAARPNGGRNPK